MNSPTDQRSREELIDALERSQRKAEFYQRRVDLLQRWQHSMRDPERILVCDIIANAQILPDPEGLRYGHLRETDAAEPTASWKVAAYDFLRTGAHYTVKCGEVVFHCGGHHYQKGVGAARYPEAFDAGIREAMAKAHPLPTPTLHTQEPT